MEKAQDEQYVPAFKVGGPAELGVPIGPMMTEKQ